MNYKEALLTDLYQLTMGAAYLEAGKAHEWATFDLFVRKVPKDWGYLIACGVDEAIDYATQVQFSKSDLEYLADQKLFTPTYLDYLKDFRFSGDIYAVREGTPIIANTPILRVSAPRVEAQFLETALLNTINFPTLVASKASRIKNVAGSALLAEFGLRRAQGAQAGLIGARAAFIGGFGATSDVEAGKRFGIPITGTHAHSFVMSFPTELEAFEANTKTFPNNSTLLIDTYNTMDGAIKAVEIAKALEKMGKRLGAIRIDSGDLAISYKQVKALFEASGVGYVRLIASNDLDEYRISELIKAGAIYDGYGVGTRLAVGHPDAALSGVYKLVQDESGPKIKLSSEKRTNPAVKQVFRQVDNLGNYQFDLLALQDEKVPGTPLLKEVVRQGVRIAPEWSLKEIKDYSLGEVAKLPSQYRQLIVSSPYPLKNSDKLSQLIDRLVGEHQEREEAA